jgi:hypothetical protein
MSSMQQNKHPVSTTRRKDGSFLILEAADQGDSSNKNQTVIDCLLPESLELRQTTVWGSSFSYEEPV